MLHLLTDLLQNRNSPYCLTLPLRISSLCVGCKSSISAHADLEEVNVHLDIPSLDIDNCEYFKDLTSLLVVVPVAPQQNTKQQKLKKNALVDWQILPHQRSFWCERYSFIPINCYWVVSIDFGCYCIFCSLFLAFLFSSCLLLETLFTIFLCNWVLQPFVVLNYAGAWHWMGFSNREIPNGNSTPNTHTHLYVRGSYLMTVSMLFLLLLLNYCFTSHNVSSDTYGNWDFLFYGAETVARLAHRFLHPKTLLSNLSSVSPYAY